MSRIKLAQITGNDLAIVPVDEPAPGRFDEVLGRANCAMGEEEPVLSEAVRALLIMTGCVARFAGNYWMVQRRSESGENQLVGIHRKKYRTQTGVPVNGSYEDWRRELNAFVGGLGS